MLPFYSGCSQDNSVMLVLGFTLIFTMSSPALSGCPCRRSILFNKPCLQRKPHYKIGTWSARARFLAQGTDSGRCRTNTMVARRRGWRIQRYVSMSMTPYSQTKTNHCITWALMVVLQVIVEVRVSTLWQRVRITTLRATSAPEKCGVISPLVITLRYLLFSFLSFHALPRQWQRLYRRLSSLTPN